MSKKNNDRQTRRDRAAAAIAEQKRRERRTTILIQAVVALVLVGIAGGVAFALLGQEDAGPATAPAGLTDDGSIRFGADDAEVTLQAVEDFQCPACKAFEEASGDLLAEYRAGDQVAVEYRPMAFLDNASTTEYSSRALNASFCVLDEGGQDAWMDYHDALFAQQPAEGGEGLPDEQLISMADEVGVSGDTFEGCVTDDTYGTWIDQQTEDVLASGVDSTPTVLLDGEQLENVDPQSIEQAVTEAVS